MGRRKKTFFEESLAKNERTYAHYIERLTELSVSMFEWKNLPDTVDPRFLELTLFSDGQAVYFNDDTLGNLTLQCANNGHFNVYRIPIRRRAYAVNGYQKNLDDTNSVIIWNNYLHTNSLSTVIQYAEKLYNIDRIIDVNCNAQKTPVVVQCPDTQRMTMLNMYKEIDGNAPVILGTKDLDLNYIKVFKTDAPYVCDKLYELKTQIWNEAMTYLGISNVNTVKKERMITDEVTRNLGGTIANRYSRLNARREACDKINKMFGTNIEVNYREDFESVADVENDSIESEVNDNE